MNQIPAIAVGGPPHSGKSVLIYSLSQALRDQNVVHYVLRACPDGEGDWSNEVTPDQVQVLRCKGTWTAEFVAEVSEAIRARTLPLLVDVGGSPTAEQEEILAQCTDMILLARDETGLNEWRALAARNGLPVLAELHSSLTEPDAIVQERVLLRGRIHGLERHHRVQGAMLRRLAWFVHDRFAETHQQQASLHLDAAPAELTVELLRLLRTMVEAHGEDADLRNGRWLLADLPATLAYLPAGEPLAVYGRGPNWLYAALAAHALPGDFHQFDARLGWVRPLPLRLQPKGGSPCAPVRVEWALSQHDTYQQVTARLKDDYLQMDEVRNLPVPRLVAGKGLVLHGRMPHWLLTGLVRLYWSLPDELPFLATFQPQVGNMIVASRRPDLLPGALLA